MTTTTQSFGQEAFDFIDSLDRLYTPDAILGAMHRVVSRFGFDWLVITGLLPKPGESFDDLILAEHFRMGSEHSTAGETTSASTRMFTGRCIRLIPLNGPRGTTATSMGLA